MAELLRLTPTQLTFRQKYFSTSKYVTVLLRKYYNEILRSKIDNFTVFFTTIAVIAFHNIAIDAICNVVLIVVVGIVLVVVRISVTVAVGLIFYYHNTPHSEYSPFNLLGLWMVFS